MPTLADLVRERSARVTEAGVQARAHYAGMSRLFEAMSKPRRESCTHFDMGLRSACCGAGPIDDLDMICGKCLEAGTFTAVCQDCGDGSRLHTYDYPCPCTVQGCTCKAWTPVGTEPVKEQMRLGGM